MACYADDLTTQIRKLAETFAYPLLSGRDGQWTAEELEPVLSEFVTAVRAAPGPPSEADVERVRSAIMGVGGWYPAQETNVAVATRIARAAIAAMGQVTDPTPPASDLSDAAKAWYTYIDLEPTVHGKIQGLAAVRAEAKAEQHAADVKMLRDNMHLFLPIHEGLDVARRIADFLEQGGPK
jgi:hypothetical protein